MAARAAAKHFRDFLFRRATSAPFGASRHCSSAATPASKVPHSSRKARLLTGATIGLVIAGGAYVSTVDEATFCGWLFSATKLVNPFFALLDAEVAHKLAVSAAARGWVPREKRPDPMILRVDVWGRKFSNPIGLAAGFDKNAEAVEGLLGLGFGFVEIGSVTPVPQEGNPKPRIFRLRQEGAIINRCGFNSEGIVVVAKRLGAQHGKRKLDETSSTSPSSADEIKHGGKAGPGILGVNLGKNKTSEDAAADYVQGVHTLSQYADYLVINVSSPNTPGLRMLQGRKQLKDLVKKIQAARDEMQWGEEGPPPLLVKIAPDLSKEDLEDIAAVAIALRLDGLIISNTTISRPDSVSKNPVAAESGGLSGKPLFNLSTSILKEMYILTRGKIPLIGCGGVSSGEDAYKKIRAGATLVQLYTGFAYEGPASIPRIKDQTSGKMIGLAEAKNRLYYLHTPGSSLSAISTISTHKLWLYHKRLGHPSFSILKVMFPLLSKDFDFGNVHCDVCEFAKHKRVPFPISNKRSMFPFSLIHSDIWGPSHIPSISGARWFVTFIDDCTRVTWLFLLKHKSDVSHIIPQFCRMIKNQFSTHIKRFRTDNAKDFFNHTISSFFRQEGILHESSCVYTPQQNGVAERKNDHLLTTTRAFLFQNHVPKQYWGEAVLTATYLINRLPSSTLDFQSPLYTLSTFYPDVNVTNHLIPRVFGCVAFVHIHSHHRGKLEPRALKCVFLGYSSTQKGYRCYHPPTGKFYVSADVTFDEHDSYFSQPYLQGESIIEDKDIEFSFQPPLPLSQPITQSTPPDNLPKKPPLTQVYTRRKNMDSEPKQVQKSDTISETEVSPETDLPIALRKETRECAKRPLYPISQFVSFDKCSQSHKNFLTSLNTESIPNTVSEALSCEKWKNAMINEMQALEKNQTWDIVEIPEGKKPVGCKWVFTIKYKADGSVERYKARLVAKGYTQTYGIDYQETFAPVAKMNTVRVLLSLVAHFDWRLQQFDVKNAFLHGELQEEIYMEIPPGFAKVTERDRVCKLKKALYGLKQSPRAWFGRFAKVMLDMGYKQSQGDHTLFIKHSVSGGVTVLLVYVDDIIITGDDNKEELLLKECLTREFEIKELGNLKYFLGIEVARSKMGIFISQQKYITDVLRDTGKLGCKPISTPMDPNNKLGPAEEDKEIDKEMYQRLVGKLIYLSHTRPDIAYAVSVISQFMHHPKEVHLQAAYRVLHYLKGTIGKGIMFKRNETLILEAYTDADYAGSIVDRRSTTGYCTFLGGNLVTWRSKKQNVVARSSAESEFRAMAQGVCELLWLKMLLEDLKIKWDGPMRLYCDNKSAISIAHNPVQHDRTKHIEVDRHFIKEKLDSGLICTPYIPTSLQLADVLTKALSCPVFETLIGKLGMDNIYSSV